MSGFSITVNGDAVALSGGVISGNEITFTTASTIYPGDTVLGSYNAATGNIQGETSALPSFTSQPATNSSGATPPGATYPLNDDGTLAAAFGFAWLETNAPLYRQADYTYTGAATGGTAVGLPTAANAWAGQAVTVGAGTILALEAEVVSMSAAQFNNLGVAAALSSGGTPTGQAVLAGVGNNGSPYWGGSGVSNQARTSATAGYRVGIELNGNTGAIRILSTDGVAVSSTTFTPGTKFTGYEYVNDIGEAAAGQSCSLRFVLAADMTLPFAAGAVDFNGDVIA